MKFIAILVTFVVAFVGSSCAASTEQQHGRKLGKKSAKSAKVEKNPMNYFSLLSPAQRDLTAAGCTVIVGGTDQLGNAIVTYDSTLTTGELCVKLTFFDLNNAPTAININGPAQVGAFAGPAIFTATAATFPSGFPTNTDDIFVGCFDVTTSLQKEYLDSGLLYFNIITSTCTTGELRGQIFPTP